HVLLADGEVVRHLGDRRGAAELRPQLVHAGPYPQVQLLGRAGDVHGPRVVPQVALELAVHDPGGVRGEAGTAAWVVPVEPSQAPQLGAALDPTGGQLLSDGLPDRERLGGAGGKVT